MLTSLTCCRPLPSPPLADQSIRKGGEFKETRWKGYFVFQLGFVKGLFYPYLGGKQCKPIKEPLLSCMRILFDELKFDFSQLLCATRRLCVSPLVFSSWCPAPPSSRRPPFSSLGRPSLSPSFLCYSSFFPLSLLCFLTFVGLLAGPLSATNLMTHLGQPQGHQLESRGSVGHQLHHPSCIH